MSETRTVEETTRTACRIVDTLADAWAFVMEYIDQVGPAQSVTISPSAVDRTTYFVKVSGTVEKAWETA